MTDIYKGIGNSKDYEHSLDMLDKVFFSNEDSNKMTFLKLLPKLYKKEYKHCENNLVVTENGKWKGAVGLYFDENIVMGQKLVCGGIGNVAVSDDCRGKGYMRECMQLAMEKMIQKDVDYSVLGGQRQRYGYFSFGPAGAEYKFLIHKSNLKHVYGANYQDMITCKEVNENDLSAIEFIKSLHNSRPDRIVRPDGKFFDYLISWEAKPVVFMDGDTFVGYCIFQSDIQTICEIKAISQSYFEKIVHCAYKFSQKSEIRIELPLYEREYIRYLSEICESSSKEHSASLTVLNWEKFLKPQFELKASYTPLCDGEISFLIHGYKKDESFKITVKNNKVSFSKDVTNPVELSHKQAMALFFSLYSDKHFELQPNVAQWFPLDWFILSADKV